MKRLFVLRHAKSSWKDPDLADHDRPLNKRGKRDAPRMGRWMRKQGMLPELALSSTAARARTTLDQALEAAGPNCEVRRLPQLYLAGPHEIVELLREVPDNVSGLLIVGHNPGFEELVQGLTGEELTMPTAALAVVNCPRARWSELALDGEAALLQFWRPRDLPDSFT